MPWTTYEDVELRWAAPQPFTADEAKVETLIADVEDTILNRIPTIQDRIDDEEIPLARVVKVVSRVVIRHLLNPTGQRSVSETRGPNQVTITHGGNEPGALTLTDEDWRELQAATQGRRSAFSFDTTSPNATGYQCDEDIWDRIS